MEKASVSQLKDHLSAYLKKVRAGRSILIVDRDVPIATLERIQGARHDDRLTRLEKAGILRRSERPLDVAALREPGPRVRQGVLEALIHDRDEER